MQSHNSNKSYERHRTYKHANPDKRCLKCALTLSRHTVAEFEYCEFVLAGSGATTWVMNRPDPIPHKVSIYAVCEVSISNSDAVEAKAIAQKLFEDDIGSKSEMFSVRVERIEAQPSQES